MAYSDHISLKLDEDRLKDHTNPDFYLYLMDLSYFSGKLEMYFRYQDFNFKRVEPPLTELGEIKKETGTSQVPLVLDNKRGEWLRDTTYIIQHMEKEYKNVSIMPKCQVQSFFSFLMEDFADEYMWRPAMYYRWEPTYDAKCMSSRFTYEFFDAPGIQKYAPKQLYAPVLLFRQWLFSVFGEGIEDEEQHEIVKSQYLVVLETLQGVLEETPFLFGSHPTLVDFAFMGPFFRHFSSDPTPKKIMQQNAPAVFEWVARMWNCKYHQLSDTSFHPSSKAGSLPTSWDNLFPLVSEYMDYLHQNAVAWKNKQTSFKFSYKGGQPQGKNCLVQTVEYRVWCRLELQRRFHEIQSKDEEAGTKIEILLKKHGCWDALWRDGKVECPTELGVEPPFCKPIVGSGMVDSPKWPLEPLLWRYTKARVLLRFFIALAFFTICFFAFNNI